MAPECVMTRVYEAELLDSAFMQAGVKLSWSDGLTDTGCHTFRRHALPPRAAAAEL